MENNMPQYIYLCPDCGTMKEELREIEDVYDAVVCLDCHITYDGKKNKRIETGITVNYEQGSLKGRA